MYFALQSLKADLPGVIVIGIPTIDRVVIQGNADGKPPYKLVVEGRGLLKVMPPIDGCLLRKPLTNQSIKQKQTNDTSRRVSRLTR